LVSQRLVVSLCVQGLLVVVVVVVVMVLVVVQVQLQVLSLIQSSQPARHGASSARSWSEITLTSA
jgi:hypothetical protein